MSNVYRDDAGNLLLMGQMTPVLPFFDSARDPHFLTKTNTTYCKLAWNEFIGRGHSENRLLTSILQVLPVGCCIAGGSMVDWWFGNKESKDFDIFVNSAESFAQVYDSIISYSEDPDSDTFAFSGYDLAEPKNETGAWIHADRTRYVTFINKKYPERPKIQLMKIAWYTDPTHVIDSFDFTVAQIAADAEYVYFNPLTFLDLHHKRLVLHRMQFPASTMRRLIKYSQKGFYCCPQSMINISEKIMEYKDDQLDIDMNRNVYYVD
jgi:hypothetical protein